MTRAALTKLLILVILAFIICLPEFFTLYRVLKVNFLCLPYQPCGRVKGKEEGNAKVGDAKIRKEDMCDPSLQDCTEENQNITTDPESESWRGGEVKSWFMCDTDMDMTELQRELSSSAIKVHVEVSVTLQLGETETLNLTLYSHSNHSSLHFHPPEEEEEEEEEDEGHRKSFYCCLPILTNPESTNQSRCLLWLANQTVLTETAKEKLPWKQKQKDEWRCLFRVLWLALLCVVMLTIVTTVLGKIYWGGHSCKKSKVRSAGFKVAGQQMNDENQTKIIIPKALSPIQEVDTQDDIETLLDGNVDYCYTGNLHHRVHPSITEQQD